MEIKCDNGKWSFVVNGETIRSIPITSNPYDSLSYYSSLIREAKAREAKEKEISKEVKTIIDVNKTNNYIQLNVYDNGYRKLKCGLMPDIENIKVINNNVVIVHFVDGTEEKAVLSEDDTFSLEYGISICITKKLLSVKSDGNGSSVYNKLVDYCMKRYNEQTKIEKEKNDEKERAVKRAEKFRLKKEKREQKKREKLIEIQKEAYVRAMKELNNTPDKE